MSLRMMKAVWCETRPTRVMCGALCAYPCVVNREKAPFGGLKLKIPTLLFIEKMRTQSRFNVRHFQTYLLL